MNDTENSENKFYIYPNITATYRVVNDVLIAYGGIEGGLVQNTYHGFANDNPFISPTLNIIPTDKQYDAYVGLKGKLSNHMSYNISGRYMAERFKPLYQNNTLLGGPEEIDFNKEMTPMLIENFMDEIYQICHLIKHSNHRQQ